MLKVETARQKILASAVALESETVPFAQALGRYTAESIKSAIDLPRFDKSLMDGFAIRSDDFNSGIREFSVDTQLTAGAQKTFSLETLKTAQIMTGAPIPDYADAVVMIEETDFSTREESQQDKVKILTDSVCKEQNLMRTGHIVGKNEIVISENQFVTPIHVGMMAEVGAGEIETFKQPRVAVIPTGDEIVEVGDELEFGKIRNSNGPLLVSMIQKVGGVPSYLGIVNDDRSLLKDRIQRGLKSDILILSGGVSAGVLDLVPGVLEELGVTKVFHKVNIKPGKPIWFGKIENTLVFGLPGNVVSTLACFTVFVQPAIKKMAGKKNQTENFSQSAVLSRDFSHPARRTTFWPSQLKFVDEQVLVEPLEWLGSSDLKTLLSCNCFAIFREGTESYKAGQRIEIEKLPFDELF